MTDKLKSALRTPQSVIAIALLVIPFIYFLPVLTGEVFLAPGDGWQQNFGTRVLLGRMIAAGQLPLWNPMVFGGMPLAASVYPGAFYPSNWLFAILSPKLAMNLVVITTYHLALIGTYLYARRVGITRLGALLAATAFSFGGFMINHLSHTSRIAAAVWLPWILLAIESCSANLGLLGQARELNEKQFSPTRNPEEDTKAEVGESFFLRPVSHDLVGDAALENQAIPSGKKLWLWSSLGAVFIALQFYAGEPQISIFTALVAAMMAAMLWLRCESKEARLKFALAIGAMVVVGALLSLIQLLPSIELWSQSERANIGPEFFDTYSLPPWQLPGLIFPYFFGGALLPPYKVPYWGAESSAVMSGYVGMLVWLLALAALIAGRKNWRIWLWLGVTVVSIVLAFGGYLPFKFNHMLYRVPGYGTFRGVYRNQFEFTFAMAMLAGFGASSLTNLKSDVTRRVLRFSIAAMTAIVGVVAILYRFFGDSLATVKPRPADAASLTNPEFFVPIACFVISVIALWMFISNPQSAIRNSALAALLLFDLASYGYFFHWRIARYDVKARLADPPAVAFIKSREKDLNSFRIMTYPLMPDDYAAAWPEDPNFDLLNRPNNSAVRGLQSINGYDVLRPRRFGELTGTEGWIFNSFVQDAKSFGLNDHAFDLLNVKYLLVAYGGATNKKTGYEREGVHFSQSYFAAEMKPGVHLTTTAGNAAATEIAIISNLANSAHLPDGAPILKLKLHARDGRVIERDLVAGRDSSEWAYDRADVKPVIKHSRAPIAEDFDAGDFKSHGYLGRLKFDRAEIEKIEWIYAREDASLLLIRASLFDATTGKSEPLANFYLPPERWRLLDRFDEIEVYENLRAMPRAWLVKETQTDADGEIYRTIRTGQHHSLEDNGEFDFSSVALLDRLEKELPVGTWDVSTKPELKSYQPNRLEIETRNPSQSFLVLSEMYDEGWEARVDDQPTRIYRTNYVLRGVVVPPGDHRVEFVYRPRSFRIGLISFICGLATIFIGGAFVHRGRLGKKL